MRLDHLLFLNEKVDNKAKLLYNVFRSLEAFKLVNKSVLNYSF